jgi:hypothetical protein
MRSAGDVLYNFHWIVPGEAARSAQSYAGFLGGFLRRHGIKGVVNLRGTKPGWRWWDYETRICAKLGIAHRDIAFNSRRLPTRAILLEMLNAFDEMSHPFLIKCSGGQDRTSFAAALYLLHIHGRDAQVSAKAQFSRWPYLHFPKQQQRWLRAFLRFAEEHGAAGNLREWIAINYQPAEFKSWLESHGLGDAFRDLSAPAANQVTQDARQTT